MSIAYTGRAGEVHAVVGFNLALMRGEAHGLVGESGCGKSTIALAVMRHLGRAGRVVGGQILFQGRDLQCVEGRGIAPDSRGPDCDGLSGADGLAEPVDEVGEQLMEVPIYHEGVGRREAGTRAARGCSKGALARRRADHGLLSASDFRRSAAAGRHCHGAAVDPQVAALDEPTTSLDVTVEAGIVDLIREISAEFGTTMIYISHNLGSFRRPAADYGNVSGEAVESRFGIQSVFTKCAIPTRAACSTQFPYRARQERPAAGQSIRASSPPPNARPPGCYFAPRCDYFAAGGCDPRSVAMRAVEPRSEHVVVCALPKSLDRPEGAGKPRNPTET